MKSSFRVAVILAAAWSLSMTGCGTMRGLGEDIQTAGRGLEKAAKGASR